MKKHTSIYPILIAFLFMGSSLHLNAQTETGNVKKGTNTYWSFSTEMIFSFAKIDNQGNENGNVMRWAPWFNPQAMVNFDFGKNFGLFTGVAVRNVGFIYDNPYDSNNTKFKYRTYNLGIPIGFKLGRMSYFHFFGGYEIEFPFVYKEKQFVNEVKTVKDIIWFSGRVEPVQQSLMAGIQFPYGAALKFKYYLTNFFNKDYAVKVDGQNTYPYNFNANVFYFSLSWNLFTNWHAYDPKEMKKHHEKL